MIDGNNELENHIYYVCLINVILFLIGVFAAYGVYYEYLYEGIFTNGISCLLYTSPSPRDRG